MLNNNHSMNNTSPVESYEPLIFELSRAGRIGANLPEEDVPNYDLTALLPPHLIREDLPLPEVSELDVVRHFTRLSHRNYGIDVGFYPLGSCTMKYNPKVHEKIASMLGFAMLHPLQPEETVQGALAVLWRMQNLLSEIGGMDATTLQPAAGAHGELLAMMITRAYHVENGDDERNEIIIPDSAHGTNPASAARCGFAVRSIPSGSDGCIALEELEKVLSERTAALMLTNPNTLGLFEKEVVKICALVHEAGGLVYCDGANMNALLGVARPGDMGFDIMHFNLHKTFSTPHGGGGPGGGAVSVKRHLEPYLPIPVVERRTEGESERYWLNYESPRSIGRIHSFYGAFLVALRAYAYILTLGSKGLREVAENAILNANYVRAQLKDHYDVAYNSSLCMHEVVLSAKRQKQESGVRALDISKRLMDYGFHPPTNYFPLIVPEALMIEPTETESKQTLDRFVAAMIQIAEEAKQNPELVKSAPHETPISRLDEVKAVKELDVRYEPLFIKKNA